ncbi:hypothetical protein QQX09_09125 [Demequina sp. SYSU T00192]|uniref:LppM domain-containing protein n=1 Tax=Demequina litoralis TaxID=3051660 RepID=A0ABT8GA60_9MICO|nr:hypothetical protein [Demequina sp. SYSU T00192]MDN4476013.1 hypothetical protein [Demequina sp. SYSU T00192]
MTNRLRTLGLVAATALVLTGCLRVEMSIALNPDDTADGSFLMAIEKGSGEAFDVSDDDLLEQFTADSEGDFETGTVEPYEDEDYIGTRVSFDDEPLGSFAGETDDDLAIVRDGDDYVVSGSMSDAEDEDLGSLPGADMVLSITFPGEVSEHNGTLEGTTVTWDLMDAPEELAARGSASPPSAFPVWAWPAIGAGALAVVAIAVVAVLRRRGGTDESAGDDAVVLPVETVEFVPGPAPASTGMDAPTAELPTPADTIETGSVEGTDGEEDHPR